MKEYTVEKAMPTGQESQTYGTEYVVKFKELEETHKLWYKKDLDEGFKQYGEIVDGKFKKRKNPEYANNNSSSSSSKSSNKSYKKSNSDGQRQGMCINNAANFIASSLANNGTIPDPEGWADAVYEYANALYAKGDLEKEAQTKADEEAMAILFGKGEDKK